MKPQNMYVSEVRIEKIPTSNSQELSEIFIRTCDFCEKKCQSQRCSTTLCQKISEEPFFCTFCIRSNHHHKSRKDVLILSFRPLFAQLYYENYLSQATLDKLYLSNIEDFIHAHRDVGLLNPAFSYDPDTMLWFVDFAKVGKKSRQIELIEVYKTVLNILFCFNFWKSFKTVDPIRYFLKFKTAIDEFHQKRSRPKNKRMLIPTLSNCGEVMFKVPSDKARTFIFLNKFTKFS